MGSFVANGGVGLMAMSSGFGQAGNVMPGSGGFAQPVMPPAQGMDEGGIPRGLLAHFPANGPLKLSQYMERLVTSNGTQSVYLSGSGCTVRYAYVTQRGYYPDVSTT